MALSYENGLVNSDFKKLPMLTPDIHNLYKTEAKTDFGPKFT